MLVEEYAIISPVECFQHAEACRLSRAAQRHSYARTIVIDLSFARDATTAAFADLVVLRRLLLNNGRDLKLYGLRDRAAKIYSVNRLDDVLPMKA